MEVIRQWLQEGRQRPVKQRHTARGVFQRLREEYGFPGSERTVRRAVRVLRVKNRQEQAAWVVFGSHFLFESEYVTPGRGQEEQGSLRPLPARLPAACVSRLAKVNRRQQVRLAGNWYSVPPR